jgi:hypothetical protein
VATGCQSDVAVSQPGRSSLLSMFNVERFNPRFALVFHGALERHAATNATMPDNKRP